MTVVLVVALLVLAAWVAMGYPRLFVFSGAFA